MAQHQHSGLSVLIATLVICLSFSPIGVQAQQFSITAGSISTCSGVLEDSGGPSVAYGNNENYTVVICPSTAGDAISLNWAVFSLSTQLPNPIDRIRIWDGNSTSATYLGEYTGTSLQGLITSATTFNTTGCLTVQFTSNSGGTGNFAAGITCYTPCERPTAEATMSEPTPYPALVCVGEPITFDGTGSYAATGFNISEYTWIFDDGDSAFTSTTTHSYSEPGEYIVQLNLLDDNDCVNSNLVDLQVLVSTTPSFAGTSESVETCLGATVDLTATVAPTTWTGIPEANFGDGVYLPDDLGIAFTSDLVFTQFEPGQTIGSTDDILSVCASMEHSFMGDLVVQLTCPSGQTMLLHQQNGGGTFLGDANDMDNNNNPVAGICWDYCFSPTATLGTWANCAQWGTTPNVMASSQGTSLIPGTYTPVQPFTNMVGCPLNGTWTFTVTDLWGADNGFLCSWAMNFDPSIIPDVTQFTPTLGSTIDSAAWTGPFLTTDPNDPLVAVSTPDAPGTYDYQFSVTDNFGCSYDTTISITIAPQMVVDAGSPIVLCNDSLPMAGEVIANGPPSTCQWDVTLYESFGDTWNGASLTVIIDGVSSTYTVSTYGTTQLVVSLEVSPGSTISLQYAGGTWNYENSFTLHDDQGNTIYASPSSPPIGVVWTGTASCGGGVSPLTYEWSPATGLSDVYDPISPVFVTTPIWYQLAAFPANSPECAVFDSVLVSPAPDLEPGLDDSLLVCLSDPIFLMTDSLGGTPATDGAWTTGPGIPVPSSFSPSTMLPGIYDYTYTVTNSNGCIATSELVITMLPDTDPRCCGVPDAGPDSSSCDLTFALSATPGNTGVGQWSGPADASFGDIYSPQTSVTMPVGSGGTHRFYWSENDGAFCNTIDSVDITFTDVIEIAFSTTDAICFSYCDGAAQSTITGGNGANDFDYVWSSGTTDSIPSMVGGLCAGTHQLNVTDNNGCTAQANFVIGQPVLLEIDSMVAPPVTCSGDCDGAVEIFDTQAVEWSFDNGASWSSSSQLPDACEGIYHVQIRDTANCIGTGSIVVTGPPLVVAGYTWGPIPATVDDPWTYFHNTSSGAQYYFWDIAGLATTMSQDTTFIFPETEPGVYTVCLTAYNYNGCTDSVCHQVTIDDVLEPYVPNAFTPDGNGVNDNFGMSVNIPVITDFEMQIYDRWGQRVYHTKDPYAPWLGSMNNDGKILPTGVYTYRITFEIARIQTRRELMGHVTLLK